MGKFWIKIKKPWGEREGRIQANQKSGESSTLSSFSCWHPAAPKKKKKKGTPKKIKKSAALIIQEKEIIIISRVKKTT